jgi:RimJ/RimL family protein N-acetyltransferase
LEAGAVLHGRLVTLRPLRQDELDVVRAAQDDPSYGGDPPDAAADERLRARIARSGRLVDGWLDLGIEAGGRLVGDIGARHPAGAFPPGVFEVGISLFRTEDRGRGYGREAVALLSGHLFANLGAARIQATTPVGNTAMRTVLAQLGFAEEGTLRDFLAGEDGARVDAAMYGMTRADWAARAGS